MKKQIAKHRVFVFVLVTLLAPSIVLAAGKGKTVKVFLLGGQSNMVGCGKSKDLKAPHNKPILQIKIWAQKAKQWETLSPDAKGISPDRKGEFGPEVPFGHAIATVLPDEDIRLVKYAKSGTALYNDWAPSGGPQYKAFMATAKAALANLDDSGTKYEILGMLWLQGESDALEKQGQAYEKNLSDFIKHMREQFKTPDMPFLIARVRDHYGKGPQADAVRAAQENLAKTMKNVAWFNTDDCTLFNAGHYDSGGLIVIGDRFAKAYSELVPADREYVRGMKKRRK